jgi:hypothetical protein
MGSGGVCLKKKRKVRIAPKLRAFRAATRAHACACDPVMSLLTVELFDRLDPPAC